MRYNQTLSDCLPLFAGVPQGTKLNNIAFQAVINDAAVGGTAHNLKYVDDLTFAENRTSSELSNLQGDLDDFLDWSVTNQLKLNPTKCQALQIGFIRAPPPHPDLKIGQSVLAFVNSAKVLRVWLQNDLKWDTQVSYMNKNAVKRFFMLCSLKRFGFNKSELVTVYKSYIRPCSNILMLVGIRVSLPIKPTSLKEFLKKGIWELFLVLIIFHMQMHRMCVMLIVYLPGGSNIVLSLRNPFPNVAGLVSCSLRAEARHMVGNWGTTPNSPSPVLSLIDMLVVQSHIMWSWSTANSYNWTSCLLFSSLLACFTVGPFVSVVYCCAFSFVSGHSYCTL